MKNYLQYWMFIISGMFASAAGFAQSGLHIASGTDLFIRSGTVFSADSLVLTPAADFTISGPNSATRTNAVTATFSGASINRVFHFSNTVTSFSGTIAIYYRDEELNNVPEKYLTLNIYDGNTWNAYNASVSRDAVNNIVTTTGLNGISIRELTLAASLVECDNKLTYYQDSDGDGYGNASLSQQACTKPRGYVTDNTDCNDNNAQIHPGAAEVCNGVDDDCDGQIDEGLTQYTYYLDSDGDGYGTASTITSCSSTAPRGYASRAGDCNDNNAAINPGAAEVCDGIDNNCNGQIDEGVKTTFYQDNDKDGYGNPSMSIQACTAPAGYVANNTDCNDNNAAIHPGANEICGNGIDDNCDGQIDEGCNNKALLSINDATVYESAGSVTLTITLSKKSTEAISVNYTTVDGTAKSKATKNNSADFTAKSGTVTIPAGQLSASITINIVKDNIQEPAEQFTVELSRPVNAAIADGIGTVTIQDGAAPLTAPAITAITSNRQIKIELDQVITNPFSVRAMPNPTTSYFTLVIQGSSNRQASVRVWDAAGRIVEARNGISINTNLRLGAAYRPGIYFVEVMQGSERVIMKLVKVSK